jgi:primosomal protein N' (replication factor Y)
VKVCRVAPDVPAIDREFDYVVPESLSVAIGSIVRVPLHGRRVRGWVVADGVEPHERTNLLDLAKVSSIGPDAATVALCRWAAHRFVGPLVTFLRAASPTNAVTQRPRPAPPAPVGLDEPESDVDRAVDGLVRDVEGAASAALRWPPLLDRRRLVARLLPDSGSAIVVTADGLRAAALVAWLRSRGARAVLDRSDLSRAERTQAWTTAAAGSCVVVGGRVATFAPVPDLRLAIVVEDGDEALQEERTPTWHAREVLAERCRRAGAPLRILGAAPTVEAVAGAARVAAPSHSIERSGWPPVEIVDRRGEPPGAGLFPERVAAVLRAERDARRPAVCVVNRRGRARLLACPSCGALTRWDARGRPIWDEDDDGGPDAARDAGAERPAICLECGAGGLRQLRAGVRRLQEEIAALLPGAHVADVDAETGDLGALDRIDVLVGTEAVLHRDDVRAARPGLVAFLDFDQELLAPRMRAAEQALRLLVRGARLLDRRAVGERRLLVQTRQPDHVVVRSAVAGEPDLLIAAELERRRALELPPFAALAELRGSTATVVQAVDALREVNDGAIVVLGPRVAGGQAGALVKAPDHEALGAAVAVVMADARSDERLRVAVDPPRV